MRRIATTLGVAMAAFVALLVPASAGATAFAPVDTFGAPGSRCGSPGFSVRVLVTVKAVDGTGKKAKKSKAFRICG